MAAEKKDLIIFLVKHNKKYRLANSLRDKPNVTEGWASTSKSFHAIYKKFPQPEAIA